MTDKEYFNSSEALLAQLVAERNDLARAAAIKDMPTQQIAVECGQVPSFLAEIEMEREGTMINEPENQIETIHVSGWHQGFGSECKEHLGRDKDGGFYYATEHSESPENDLYWHGPYATREEAEKGLSEAYDRWDERTGEQEQAWEDQQIAQIEKDNTNTKGDNMNDTLLKAGYEAQAERIQQLESWVTEVIARPSMSRELRLQGLELVEAQRPDVRLAVERICPSQSRGLEHSLEIER